MAGPDHAVVNVYHCQAVNMVIANQRHFNAFVTTQVDGWEHFVINVGENYLHCLGDFNTFYSSYPHTLILNFVCTLYLGDIFLCIQMPISIFRE